MCNKVVVFDLDDTLYKEIDFLKSAYKEIATSIGNPELIQQMLEWYKNGDKGKMHFAVKYTDRMGIPRGIKNRNDLIKEQARKTAIQNNTLWMLLAS